MKTLFSNPKNLIKYGLTLIAFAICLGVVFVIGFGFNTSTDFGKAYEISIDCFDEGKLAEYEQTANNILKESGYSAKESFIEERSICDTIVIRYNSNSENNATKIEADIEAKLNLNENLVSVEQLSLSTEKSMAIKLLIPLGIIAVVIFLYALIRFGIKESLALIVNLVVSTILPLALLAITRLELSLEVLGLLMVLSTLSTVLFMFIISKMNSIQKAQEKEESFKTNYINYLEANKIKVIIPACLIFLIFAVLIFTFNRAMIQIGVAGLVIYLAISFMAIIMSPALLMTLKNGQSEKTKKK